jgi:hypothetical protein
VSIQAVLVLFWGVRDVDIGLRPLIAESVAVGVVGKDIKLELELPLIIAGLAYRVSSISAKLLWRFRILIARLTRPPQNSAGLPGHGTLQEP